MDRAKTPLGINQIASFVVGFNGSPHQESLFEVRCSQILQIFFAFPD
jgi:hypothetical protein